MSASGLKRKQPAIERLRAVCVLGIDVTSEPSQMPQGLEQP